MLRYVATLWTIAMTCPSSVCPGNRAVANHRPADPSSCEPLRVQSHICEVRHQWENGGNCEGCMRQQPRTRTSPFVVSLHDRGPTSIWNPNARLIPTRRRDCPYRWTRAVAREPTSRAARRCSESIPWNCASSRDSCLPPEIQRIRAPRVILLLARC
jgi:hypothetical protein